MPLRQYKRSILLIGSIGVIVFAVSAWMVGSYLIAPANGPVGVPPDNFPAQTVQIRSDQGNTISGWYLAAPDSVATVILLHPLRADRRAMLTRAQMLRDHGYSTLLIDLQAHGDSAGDSITFGFRERHDVTAAVNYTKKTYPEQKIAIVGVSLGGASALLASPKVDALVIESAYPTITEAVHNRIEMRLGMMHHLLSPILIWQLYLRLGISPDQLCPTDQISLISCPILIAAGDQDQHTTVEETQRMFMAAKEPKKLVLFEGAAHVDLLDYDSQKYEEQIIGFLNQTLLNPLPNSIRIE